MSAIRYTNFMRYWKAMNELAKSFGQPELNFGAAMGFWKDTENMGL